MYYTPLGALGAICGLLLHLSLQYFTSSQFLAHFFRQVNGLLHIKQILVGK